MSDAAAELRRRFLATLERTQWLPPADLARYQASLLEPLLRHAAAAVPFYRDGRLAPVLRPGGGLDRTRWADIPILTRAEARAAGTALHAETVPAAIGPSHIDYTSGSTGTPLSIVRSAATSMASACCSERHYRWLQVGPDAHIAHLDTEPFAETVRDTVPDGRRHSHLDASLPGRDPLVWLRDIGATHLVSMPSYVRALARDSRAGRAPALRLAGVLLYGEVLTEETRAEIAAAFGAHVGNRYAGEEVGLIAGDCAAGSLHVQSELLLLEIVDAAGSPVPAGVEGDVVVTGFYNFHMPFIRYALGDRATLSPEPCRCGRHLPVLGGVAGRSRDVFRFPDGSRVWPVVPFTLIAQRLPARQLQIVQTALDHVVVRYVADPASPTPVDADGVVALVRDRLWPGLTVTIEAVADIPREPSGKFRDYVSRIDD